MTGANVVGVVVVLSSHFIVPVDDTKTVILSSLLIVTVIVAEAEAEAEAASNTIVTLVMDVTFPLVVFLAPAVG
jgi:hypothetical protein